MNKLAPPQKFPKMLRTPNLPSNSFYAPTDSNPPRHPALHTSDLFGAQRDDQLYDFQGTFFGFFFLLYKLREETITLKIVARDFLPSCIVLLCSIFESLQSRNQHGNDFGKSSSPPSLVLSPIAFVCDRFEIASLPKINRCNCCKFRPFDSDVQFTNPLKSCLSSSAQKDVLSFMFRNLSLLLRGNCIKNI